LGVETDSEFGRVKKGEADDQYNSELLLKQSLLCKLAEKQYKKIIQDFHERLRHS